MKNSIKYIITRLITALLIAFSFWLLDTHLVKAYAVYPDVSTLTVNYTNSVGGGGNNVRHFTTTPPVYASINRFSVIYSGDSLFGILDESSPGLCASVSFAVTAPTDYRLSRSYNTLTNWSIPATNSVFTTMRYVDVYYANSKYYYTFYFSANNTSTSYLVGRIDFDYNGSANPFYTNQDYSFSATTPVTRFVDCSNISENMISSEIDELHKDIDNQINSVNSNIDSMKDKQDETNNKLDEANQTSKGILGKIGDLLTGIPNWFSNLANSIGDFFANLISSMGNFFSDLKDGIGNFFSNLFDGIQTLFMGEEKCGLQEVEEAVPVPPTKLFDVSNLKPSGNTGYIPFKPSTLYLQYDDSYVKGVLSISFYDEDFNELGSFKFPATNNLEYITNDLGNFVVAPFGIISSNPELSESKVAYLYATHGKYGTASTITAVYSSIYYHDEITTVEKEVCTRQGGLFGILNNFISSIGNWFNNLFSIFEDTDVSDSTSDGQGFFEGFEDNDYGLSDIVSLPLVYIGKITTASCSPLVLPLPFVDKNATLPCMTQVYHEYFGSFLTLYQTITFGVIAYWVCINIFAMVRNFKNPDNDRIEVLDL